MPVWTPQALTEIRKPTPNPHYHGQHDQPRDAGTRSIALTLGAAITRKPPTGTRTVLRKYGATKLIPKIKALCPESDVEISLPKHSRPPMRERIEILAMGVPREVRTP